MNKGQKGLITTTIMFAALGILVLGIVAGRVLIEKGTKFLPRAQVYPFTTPTTYPYPPYIDDYPSRTPHPYPSTYNYPTATPIPDVVLLPPDRPYESFDNVPIIKSLTTDKTTYVKGETIIITARAVDNDPDDRIEEVRFYFDDEKIDEIFIANVLGEYKSFLNTSNINPGNHVIKAIAYDKMNMPSSTLLNAKNVTINIVSTPINTPVTEIYSLELQPSSSIQIEVSKPGSGYAIMALLKRNNEVVIDQKDFNYDWIIQDGSIAEISPFTGCTNNIEPPCPFDHLSIRGLNPGETTIRVTVTRISTNKSVAEGIFTLQVLPQFCQRKGQGDANCDEQIDLRDYSIWMHSQCIPATSQHCGDTRADFDNDGDIDYHDNDNGINTGDKEIWLDNRYT